jgi:hypothetical protein
LNLIAIILNSETEKDLQKSLNHADVDNADDLIIPVKHNVII